MFAKAALAKLCLAALSCIGLTALAHADSYVLANTNGGDGYITGSSPTFQLFGADNNVGANYTTYTTTVSAPETVTFNWSYSTFDCCGSYYDPAGYVVDGTYTQLSTDGFVTGTIASSGTTTVSLKAGDTFGYYVYSPDSVLGRGALAVSPGVAATTPEPGSLLLMGTGLLGVVGATRRRLFGPSLPA